MTLSETIQNLTAATIEYEARVNRLRTVTETLFGPLIFKSKDTSQVDNGGGAIGVIADQIAKLASFNEEFLTILEAIEYQLGQDKKQSETAVDFNPSKVLVGGPYAQPR